MTNTQKGMTLEQSRLGKHISGCMFLLCLETRIQIKIKDSNKNQDYCPTRGHYFGKYNRAFECAFVCISYSRLSKEESASREERVVNLIGAFKQCSAQS